MRRSSQRSQLISVTVSAADEIADFLVELRGFEPRCSLVMHLGDRARSGTDWMRAERELFAEPCR
jgi:hypothetical protein